MLVVLVVLHVVVKLALLPRAAQAPLIGDEAYYLDSARALSNLLRDLGSWHTPDTAELDRSVVGSGWFMPGMSIVLSPLFLVVPHAGLLAARVYLGVLSTLLLLVAVRDVRRTFGDASAAALLVFPGLVPMWLLFSYGAWGDLPAGLTTVLLGCATMRLVRSYAGGLSPGLPAALRVGALGIATLYLRSSALPLVAGLLVLVAIGAAGFLRGPRRWRALGGVAAATVVVAGLLLPWSVAASHSLGSRVVTTTTLPTALANTFGDRTQECFGPCDPGSTIWFAPVRYARETARVTGLGEATVLGQMSTYAGRGVTAPHYAGTVLKDFDRYLLQPAGYEDNFRSDYLRQDATGRFVDISTDLLYFPFLVLGLLVLLAVVRGPLDRQLRVLGLKLVLAALLIQPFVHLSSSRYWPTFAPVLALGAVAVLEAARARFGPGRASELDGVATVTAARSLRAAQLVVTSLAVAVVIALGVLALLR